MSTRITTTLACVLLGCTVFGSVVFLGVPLSSRLLGQWRVVQVFGDKLDPGASPLTIRFDKDGKLVGHSRCGTFTGRWTTGPDQVRFQSMVPSGCDRNDPGALESRLFQAMSIAREARVEKSGVLLMHQGKPVAMLVPQQT